ncbi:unnamed protein product [Gulo gulo]|uniref:Uncharacterized protein n=1 Tax=Gulo gulo TaxID=48420 RepID=A0A9X9M5K2_GULGU|nr:unnamed protein product [Gulo gulo]
MTWKNVTRSGARSCPAWPSQPCLHSKTKLPPESQGQLQQQNLSSGSIQAGGQHPPKPSANTIVLKQEGKLQGYERLVSWSR